MKAPFFRRLPGSAVLGLAAGMLAASVAVGIVTASSASAIVADGHHGASVQAVKTEAAPATPAESGIRQECVVPDSGWVLFYEHSNCQGRYQGWTRCGFHDIADAMHRKTSSYWDRQYGGAYTWAWEYSGFEPIFETRPNTGVRNVATWENDRAEWAELIC